jgi:hypothetical protein
LNFPLKAPPQSSRNYIGSARIPEVETTRITKIFYFYQTFTMNVETRYKKLRYFVSGVNKARKIQAKQIDILCNDLIAAHRQFIKNLNSFSFAASFYETILGKTDLHEILNAAASLIIEQIPGSSVVFFLRRSCLRSPGSIDSIDEIGSFEMYPCTKLPHADAQNQPLETFVTPELVTNICTANTLCSIEQMLEMGLQISPAMLKNISAFAVPLTKAPAAVGFILIYRFIEPSENASESPDAPARRPVHRSVNEDGSLPAVFPAGLGEGGAQTKTKLDKEMLNDITAVTAGLARAISVSVLQTST